MVIIDNKPADSAALLASYPENSTERLVLTKMFAGTEEFRYDSLAQLQFELKLRAEIVKASADLYRSGIGFEVFRKSRCNPDFWERTGDGGFTLKNGVKPSDAIRDIFANGRKYGTECATAMVIVYYKALLETFGEKAFNELFTEIHLMNWHQIDRRLREIGQIKPAKSFFPGDRRYFKNPDVDPTTPEWQGENTIDLDGRLFYGHGIGIHDEEAILKALNRNRDEAADEQAFLMDAAGRPDFKSLAALYQTHVT